MQPWTRTKVFVVAYAARADETSQGLNVHIKAAVLSLLVLATSELHSSVSPASMAMSSS